MAFEVEVATQEQKKERAFHSSETKEKARKYRFEQGMSFQ